MIDAVEFGRAQCSGRFHDVSGWAGKGGMHMQGTPVQRPTESDASAAVATHERPRPPSPQQSESASETAARDARLVSAVAAGDEAAFSELYDRYAAVVFAVCRRVLPDSNDAEDAVIDTFWDIWRRADRFDARRGQFVTYLLMLARSRAIDRKRSQSAGVPTTHAGDRMPEISFNGAMHTRPVDPGRPTQIEERRARIQTAMDQLNRGQRDAVELSFFCGLSHRQIAQCLQQPLGTIKTKVRQGLIQLRDVLRSTDGDRSL